MRQWLVAQLATRCRTSRGKIEFPSPLYGFDALFLETPSFRIRCLVVVPRNLVRAVNKVFTRRVNEMHVDFLFFLVQFICILITNDNKEGKRGEM